MLRRKNHILGVLVTGSLPSCVESLLQARYMYSVAEDPTSYPSFAISRDETDTNTEVTTCAVPQITMRGWFQK